MRITRLTLLGALTACACSGSPAAPQNSTEGGSSNSGSSGGQATNGTGGSSTTAGGSGSTSVGSIANCQLFPADNPWNQDVSRWLVHANSRNIIAAIGANKPFKDIAWGLASQAC